MFIIFERRRFGAAHDVNEFLSEFEWGCFEINIQQSNLFLGKNKSEINVNNMPIYKKN